jgi:hypothetical protein
MNHKGPKIEHALIVSGPSAGGKSTFISELMAGRLDAAVARLLPRGAAEWTYVDGNDILKRDIVLADALPEGRNTQGVIVHYDFVHILRVGYSCDYFKDPIFQIFGYCDKVTFCDVRPSPERLFQQFSHRQHEQQRRKGKLRVLWRQMIHAPLRQMRLRLGGERHIIKEDIYRDPEWLKHCYDQWDEFLGRASEMHGNVTLIRVEPVGSNVESSAFRLIGIPL